MARSVRDCELVMRTLCTPEAAAADPVGALPVPWNAAAWKQGAAPARGETIRVGYLMDQEFFQAAEPYHRAVQQCVVALESIPGVEVVPVRLRPGLLREAALLYYAIMGADGKLTSFKAGLRGEALHPMYGSLERMASMPETVRWVLKHALRAAGMHRPADLLSVAHGKSALELWQWVGKRILLKRELLASLAEQDIAVWVEPGFGLPALPHMAAKDLNVAACYTFVYNLFDFPAGTLPVTQVREGECSYYAPADQQDMYTSKAKAAMQGAAGLPIAVQVVGIPFTDEHVLRVMGMLETALGDRLPAPAWEPSSQ